MPRGMGSGKRFEAELKHTLQIYEMNRQLIFSKNEALGGRFHRQPRLLPDFFVFVQSGKFILLEAKVTEKKTMFPFANIKNHQINCMRKVSKWPNGFSYFLINFRNKKRNDNDTFAVPIQVMLKYRKETGRNSFARDWIYTTDQVIRIKPIKFNSETSGGNRKVVKGWDLSKLLEIDNAAN